jgi:hypothetical protein
MTFKQSNHSAMAAKSVYELETIGCICGCASPAGMLVVVMTQRISMPQRTFIQLAIPSSNLSSLAKAGAGVTSTRFRLRLKSKKPR